VSNPNAAAVPAAGTAKDDLKITGNSPAEKLVSLLGFDPGKGDNIVSGVLGQAVQELREEKAKVGLVKAKELLTKLMALKAERDKFKREADQKVAKMDKEFGKAWSAIERIANGQPPEDPNEQKDGDKGGNKPDAAAA